MGKLISGRTRYVEDNGLDADFCLPDANWKGEGERSWLYRGTTALLHGDYDAINSLRLYSQIFSGYSLLEMRPIPRGIVPPDRVPPDLAARMLSISRRIDEWVVRYRELSRHVPDVLRVSPPNRFGEAGWIFDGRIVNYDTYACLERVALLNAAGLLQRLSSGASGRIPRILEIGGGYGGLAYHLKTLLPRARYIAVDLPESLLFAALYLTTLFPDESNVLVTSPEMIGRDLDRPGFTFIP
ncbi:MAG: putative sugar O-methyltransferase, partial [Burkholderiales bacterium]